MPGRTCSRVAAVWRTSERSGTGLRSPVRMAFARRVLQPDSVRTVWSAANLENSGGRDGFVSGQHGSISDQSRSDAAKPDRKGESP